MSVIAFMTNDYVYTHLLADEPIYISWDCIRLENDSTLRCANLKHEKDIHEGKFVLSRSI